METSHSNALGPNTGESETDLLATLIAHGVFLQREIAAMPAAVCLLCYELVFAGIPRTSFRELHRGYQLVPEVYVLKEQFNEFFPPEQHLDNLKEDIEDISSFMEALGCYIEPTEQQLERLNSYLYIGVPGSRILNHPGLVLMCWERIEALAEKWEDSSNHLLHVVGFHEHSHAARAATLLKGRHAPVLRAEETVAQWETYMFLRSRKHAHIEKTIETMKKLMQQQPTCYRIPVP